MTATGIGANSRSACATVERPALSRAARKLLRGNLPARGGRGLRAAPTGGDEDPSASTGSSAALGSRDPSEHVAGTQAVGSCGLSYDRKSFELRPPASWRGDAMAASSSHLRTQRENHRAPAELAPVKGLRVCAGGAEGRHVRAPAGRVGLAEPCASAGGCARRHRHRGPTAPREDPRCSENRGRRPLRSPMRDQGNVVPRPGWKSPCSARWDQQPRRGLGVARVSHQRFSVLLS